MPDLVKRTDLVPSLASQTPTPENQIDGVAGEDIDFADLCYIGADGLFYRASTGSTAATWARGLAATNQRAGWPVTIYRVAVFGYTDETGSNAVVPGVNLYVSANPGKLSTDVPGTGNVLPVAFGRNDGAVHVNCP